MAELGVNCVARFLSGAALASALFGQPSVLTWHNDNARTGQNLQETILTPSNVNAGNFGKLFTITVDGKVDAQPLYVPSLTMPGKGVHNVLYVVTEHDSAYAFDADTGASLWHVSLLGSGEIPSDDHSCSQVTPEIGATATPVIDPHAGAHGIIYVVAMSKDSSAKYHHRLHALDLTTGSEQFAGPVEIQASSSGAGAENQFNPTVHKERSGLLLVNGVVYTSWSSHCDFPSYAGWVIGYNATTLHQVSALNLVPNGKEAGLWNAGAGPAADASGNIYALTGNGTFDTSLNAGGFPNNGDYGNAFVKLATTTGSLGVADYFTMSNTTAESSGDVDFGSGGAMLLPPLTDSQGAPRNLAIGAGKDQHIYVVDRNNLGKFNSGSNSIYQDMVNALPGGVWSSPAWFNGKLYYGDVGGSLKAFAFTNGAFQAAPVSHSTNTFRYPGTTPSISASGTSNGIVWAVENSPTAVLHAYDASDLSNELYNSEQAANGRDRFGAGNKYIVPTIVNGKVYVGTTNGIGVLGLISQPVEVVQLAAVSVNPGSGSGVAQTFTASYADPNGASDLSLTYLAFGTSPLASKSCIVAYQRARNAFLLLDDFNSGFVPGSITQGGGGALSNNQCTVTGAGGAAVSSETNLTVPFAIAFASGFTGSKNIYGMAQNNGGVSSGWQLLGTWTPSGAAVTLRAVSVTPNTGTGKTQTFSAVYMDSNGAQDIALAYLDFGTSAGVSNSCIVLYQRSSNSLQLLNDAGGSDGSLSNSQCSVSGAGGAAVSSGNNLTVQFAITFASGFTGSKNVYGMVQSNSGTDGAWQLLGTWTPSTVAAVGPISVSPSSGTGVTQTFTASFSDPNGASDLALTYLDFGTSPFANQGCIAAYQRARNVLLLLDDFNSGFVPGSITPGGSGTLSNSQCTLSGAGGAASAAGSNLTVPFAITFSPSFTGAKNVYGWVQYTSGINGQRLLIGSWLPK